MYTVTQDQNTQNPPSQNSTTSELHVLKRDGSLQAWDIEKIKRAVTKAFQDVGQEPNGGFEELINWMERRALAVAEETEKGLVIDIDKVQDVVELTLIRSGRDDPARAYIRWRSSRDHLREARLDPDDKLISDYIVTSKYARFLEKENRRETWAENTDRNKNMYLKKFPGMAEEINKHFAKSYDMSVVGSMRAAQFAGEAIEVNNCRLYNCSYTLIDRPRSFAEALYLLLCGCGVGYSVQWQHVEQLPELKHIDQTDVKHHVIKDSIEGWADALDDLMASYFRTGRYVEFAYHKIRDRGAPLKTSGGKAPGHVELKNSLEKIRSVLDKARGRKLRPIEAHDILCHSATAVLSGGIRRSAMISLFSIDDGEMMQCKTGKWFETDLQRRCANNSAVLVRSEMKKSQLRRLINFTKEFGEPGFFLTNDPDRGTNPCFSPDSRINTDKGMVRIEDLVGESVVVTSDSRVGPGDLLKDGYGTQPRLASPVRVTQKDAQLFKLKTSHGYELEVTANHKFPTPDGRKRLDELNEGDTLLLQSDEGQWGARGSFEEGYLLGHYAGDGTGTDRSAHMCLWEQDFDQLDLIKDAVNELTSDIRQAQRIDNTAEYEWRNLQDTEGGIKTKKIGGAALYKFFQSRGIQNPRDLKKLVPECVWQGNRDMVRGYLQGLFAADGTVLMTDRGTKSSLNLRLCNTEDRLLKDVMYLLSNFGIVSRLYMERKPAGARMMPDGKGGRKAYQCRSYHEIIINRPNLIRFMSKVGLTGEKEKKVNRYFGKRGFSCRKPERFITKVSSIEKTRCSDVYCLTEPVTNSLTAQGLVVGNCGEISLNPVLTITYENKDEIQEMSEKSGYKVPKLKVGHKYTGFSFCNLSSIDVSACKTEEEFYSACETASFIGTLQASYADMPYMGWVTEAITRRDALLGVSLTSIMDNPAVGLNPEILRKGAEVVNETNLEISKKIGINSAARTTCVKPEGTRSLALGCKGSGIHPHHARRYFRRIEATPTEPAYQFFKSVNPHMCYEPSPFKAMITIPVSASDDAVIKDDLSARQMLDNVLTVQKNWVLPGTCREHDISNHNVSCTVTVKDNEWDDIVNYTWKHRRDLTAISLLGETGDKVFKDNNGKSIAPREAVVNEADEALWQHLIRNYKPVDFTKMREEEDNTDLSAEAACAGGACELV